MDSERVFSVVGKTYTFLFAASCARHVIIAKRCISEARASRLEFFRASHSSILYLCFAPIQDKVLDQRGGCRYILCHMWSSALILHAFSYQSHLALEQALFGNSYLCVVLQENIACARTRTHHIIRLTVLRTSHPCIGIVVPVTRSFNPFPNSIVGTLGYLGNYRL